MKPKGFILVTAMLFLVLMSLLLLSQLQSLWSYAKVLKIQTLRQKQDYEMESLAHIILRTSQARQDENCHVHHALLDNPNPLSPPDPHCMYKGERQTYWYVIETLAIDPCLSALSKGLWVSVRLKRLTLSDFNDKVLQIVAYHPGRTRACQGETIPVKLGIASWRYLELYSKRSL